MLYIVDNNGTYGLTKGQFSATNDLGSTSKKGVPNLNSAIDMVSIALSIGATFVARSFSGDKHQLVPLIKAAILHKGFAFIDVISPCVTFNNHAQSTKSYEYFREHNEAVGFLDVIPENEEISVNYAEGKSIEVNVHDGSKMLLHKLNKSYDPGSRRKAIGKINDSRDKGEIITGLIYLDQNEEDLHDTLLTTEKPLNQLKKKDLSPGPKKLRQVNKSFS